MLDKLRCRRISPNRMPSSRGVASFVSAASILGLAILLSGTLTRATARQAPGIPDQSVGPAGAPQQSSAGMPAMQGGVPLSEAAPKADEPPTPAERIIDEAATKIGKLRSVSANLLQTVDMLNQQIKIKGNYLKAPEQRIYLLLAVTGPPDTNGTTLQVCDGETLWDYQAILEAPQAYRKFSVKPIMERLNSPDLDAKIKEQAMNQLGLAGPETLLVGLRRDFRFEEKEEATLDGKPVWIFHGAWRNRQGLTTPDGRRVNQVGLMPPYIPSDALLYLGKEDGWPYKLVLAGRQPTTLFDTRRKGPDGRYIGSKSSIETVAPTKIVLEYTDVKLNVAIQVNEFVFQPPSAASVEDNTEMMVRALDSAIRMQTDKKKADATKKDGAILDPEINIPPPPGEPAAPNSPK
jgi:outer membrane lipoprotein-sorting protein